MPQKTVKPASTQAHLPLAGIENGVIIMRDGSYRAVLAVGSTNFLLKSEQEQNALIYAYQSFLNSLNFSIQIVMQSRALDLEPYLKKMESGITDQKNELIRQQTTDYVAYVRELINVANIMDKKFYVVVSYAPAEVASKNLLSGLLNRKTAAPVKIDERQFNIHREELLQRANIIGGGLSSMGLQTTVLDTDDLVRMLYNVYNYDIAVEERLESSQVLTGNVISTQPEQDMDEVAPEPAELPNQPEATPEPLPEPYAKTAAEAPPANDQAPTGMTNNE